MLKPGIEDVLVADLNFVYVVARILEFLSPDLSRASLVWGLSSNENSMLWLAFYSIDRKSLFYAYHYHKSGCQFFGAKIEVAPFVVCHVILSRDFFLFIIYCLNVKNF